MIKLQGLHKFFNKGKSNEIHVINDISFDFPEHGMVAIFGRSGCGKTTLLNVIGGLDKVQKGSVFIEGQEMSASKDELRNRYIGYIFQNYCLNGNESCFDNVATALRLCGMDDEEEISKRVHTALSAVGMDTFYKRTPNSLSGGQQQRIAIARAIVKNAPVILADEPTGNLDEENTLVIMDILKQISKTHLVLLVTHEAKLVDYYCDSVIELSDGQIVNVRNNDDASGYVAKSKNVIYLGDFDKTTLSNEAVTTEYYGDLPENPVKVRLINRNGVLFVKVDTPSVRVLDESSEIRLEEGKFETEKKENTEENAINLAGLEDFEMKRLGHLFSFKDGVKSGISMVFNKTAGKKGAKRLRKVMTFFAIVLVFVVARFGVGIRQYKEAKSNANPNVIRVSSNGTEAVQLQQLLLSMKNDPQYEIKEVIFDAWGFFREGGFGSFDYGLGAFETYSGSFLDMFTDSDDSFESPILPGSDMKNLQVITGTDKITEMKDIVITKNIADKILKSKTFPFITSYDDLMGMYCSSTLGLSQRLYERKKENMQKEKEKASNVKKADPEEEYDPDDEYYGDDGYYGDGDYYDDGYYVRRNDVTEEDVSKYEAYLLRIVGVVDSDELIVYVNDGLFVNSILSVTAPDPEMAEEYYIAMVYSTASDKVADRLKQEHLSVLSVNSSKEIMNREIDEAKLNMYSTLSTMAVLIGLLSVCMYLIMRSIYMNRMKEIGIYRAIGVSKKNMMYRSFVETGVVTTLSAFAGYLLSSAFCWYVKGVSAKAEDFLYYPWWLAVVVLVLIYVICLFSGTLSVRGVLKRTPAEIMAKYDI
ncbi:MAG: ABC transporter ATP-binding protein/permease [Lachnospiraceae bacterium]|nr:ABC transporter ATP-binding protein/permease [Lachnospiraceae bacterium]